MLRPRKHHGFSLIELLVVLVILGVITGIAVPHFMGQRRRARVIGDAIANAKVLNMQMEQFRAENGTFGPAGATVTWTYNANPTTYSTPTLGGGYTVNPCPGFSPGGNSKNNYRIVVGNSGLTYQIDVNDTTMPGAPLAYQTNQVGAELYRMQ